MASPADKPASPAPPLRPRFYKSVGVAPHAGGYRLLLDGKTVRTPAKKELVLPTRALADAVAAEWEAQAAQIDPSTMPLTRLVNATIDGVIGREGEIRRDIAKYADTDLLCYRAEAPKDLVVWQAKTWNPVLAWAKDHLGAQFQLAEGVMPVRQDDETAKSVGKALDAYDAHQLAALHVMTTLTGSVLLALAHAQGHLSAEEAWAAAHIDEDWQASQWGEDAEAAARRARRWSDMQAASRLMRLLD